MRQRPNRIMLGYFPAKSDSKLVHQMPSYTPDKIIPWTGGANHNTACTAEGPSESPFKHHSRTRATEVANAHHNIICNKTAKAWQKWNTSKKQDSASPLRWASTLPVSAREPPRSPADKIWSDKKNNVNTDHAQVDSTHQRYWRCKGRWCAAERPVE